MTDTPWKAYELPRPGMLWRIIKEDSIPDEMGHAGFIAQRMVDELLVISTYGREEDEKLWQHVSTSYRNRIPDYDNLCIVKRTFIGQDRKAIQVFPPKAEHVNIHPYCLHLWCCLENDPLPSFIRHIDGHKHI